MPRSRVSGATRAIVLVALAATLAGCAPRQIDLADVSGKQVDEAVAILEVAGFTTKVNGIDVPSDVPSQWTVAAQEPAAGRAPHAATVTLEVTSVLASASSSCKAGEAGDGGRSLTLDMKGKGVGSGSLSIIDVMCVITKLAVPDSVLDKMNGTTAMDGRVTDSWNGIAASWKYHPDNGLDVILELK